MSSTGHMIIVGHMLGFDGPAADILTFSYSWGRFCQLFLFIKNVLLDFLQKEGWQADKGLSVWHVAAGIVPVMGVAFCI